MILLVAEEFFGLMAPWLFWGGMAATAVYVLGVFSDIAKQDRAGSIPEIHGA